jgi:hypothetical protein
MKNIILSSIALGTIVLTSCTSEVEKLQDTAINEVKETLLDPKSFKLIETKVDTLRQSDRMVMSTTALTDKMDFYHEMTDIFLNSARRLHIYDLSAADELAQAQAYVDSSTALGEQANKILDDAERLKNTPNDSIIGFEVKVRYYAKTRGGDERMGEQVFTKYNNGDSFLKDTDPMTKALSSL